MKDLIAALTRPLAAFTLGPRAVFYVAFVALVLGASGAWWVRGKFEDAKQLIAVNQARSAEHDAQAEMNSRAAQTIRQLEAQREQSEKTQHWLRAQLKKLPACPVPDAVVSVLDGERLPGDPGARPGDPAGPAAVAPDPARGGLRPPVDAGAVLENCSWNRVNTCEFNATLLRSCIAAYDAVRERYTRGR